MVPNQAVQTGQNGSFVYVVKEDRTVDSRPVTTGARVDQDMVIDSGWKRARRWSPKASCGWRRAAASWSATDAAARR